MASRVKADPETDLDALLTKVRQQFLDAEQETTEERAEGEEARGYYDGKQWTEAEAKILRARKQPVVTDNKIKDKIEFMLGMERKGRTDPKAFARNQNTDEQQAEAATDGLRYVSDDNLFNYVRSAFAEEIFIEGRGSAEIIVDPSVPGPIPKIVIREIAWDRTYVDPRSRRLDYKDARYKGIVIWMDADDALEKWPDQAEEIEASFDESLVNSDTYEDSPHFYVEGKHRRRVQIFEHYYIQKGEWWYCKFVAGGFLEKPAVSTYLDADTGRPDCPIEMQALYREKKTGRAYGLVRRYKDLQDEWNKRRSKAVHQLNTKQVFMESGAAGSADGAVEKLRKEVARPDGIAEFIPGMKWEVKDGADLSQAHLNMMVLAGQSLQATGPNAALAGLSGDISGRAKEFDQQGGLIAVDYPFDAVRYMTLRIYRQVWNRIKQFWTDEAWVRVRDEEQVKFTALNRKVTRREVIAAELATQQIPEEEKAEILARVAADPTSQQPMVLNNVADIDVDINIDEVPDVVNLQQEQFGMLVELAKSGAVQIPPKALIEASQLRNKRKIIESMSGAEDPVQQQLAALELKTKELEGMVLEANAARTMAQAKQAEAATAESQTDAAIKVATFISPPQPAGKTSVQVS